MTEATTADASICPSPDSPRKPGAAWPGLTGPSARPRPRRGRIGCEVARARTPVREKRCHYHRCISPEKGSLSGVEKEKSARNRKRFRRFGTTSKRTREAIFYFILRTAALRKPPRPKKSRAGALTALPGRIYLGRRTCAP